MRPGLNSKRPRNHRPNTRRGPSHGRSQSLDSNGPDIKVRGNASQIYEKYQTLARDAHSFGDRVMAENYFQHAEHYYRVLNHDSENQRSSPQPQRQGANGADGADDAAGGDFGEGSQPDVDDSLDKTSEA